MSRKFIMKSSLTGVIFSILLSTVVQAGTGTVTGDRVNIRTAPSITSAITGKKSTGEKVNIVSKAGDWYEILLDNNQKAFISSTYIKEEVVTTPPTIIPTPPTTVNDTSTETKTEEPTNTEPQPSPEVSSNVTPIVPPVTVVETAVVIVPPVVEKVIGIVTADILNLRSTASTSSGENIIAKLHTYEKVTILKTEGDWYYVSTVANQVGYAFKDYVQITDNTTSTTSSSTPSEIRIEMVAFAKQFLGNPYAYGGTSLTKGADCSGFTQQIYKNFKYSINRTASTQRKNGTVITVAELQLGDLVFYGYSGVISHVAIYIGDGKIIHANTSSTGIVISNLYSSGKPLIGCNRILQ